MKIAIVGGTGNIGSRVAKEAASRGHSVSTISRHPEKAPSEPNITSWKGDITDPRSLEPLIEGHDAVISAVRFSSSPAANIIAAVKEAAVPRLLVVGGSASLEVAPGKTLFDTPEFPDAYKPEAGAGLAFLKALRAETELDWTFLSPSAGIAAGERTGKFRLGGDQLLTGADGKSFISIEDFAIALVDELENPKHTRRRFTVGY
jgi:hypothetical protein